MKIKITSQEQNPLLKRREIAFEVEHKETGGTPSRREVRKELASKLKRDAELVYVKRMETRTGTMIAVGKAAAYDSVEQAKLVEPEHIIIRHAPLEEPKEPEKAIEEPKEATGEQEENVEKHVEERAEEKAEKKEEEKGEETSG